MSQLGVLDEVRVRKRLLIRHKVLFDNAVFLDIFLFESHVEDCLLVVPFHPFEVLFNETFSQLLFSGNSVFENPDNQVLQEFDVQLFDQVGYLLALVLY